MNLGMIWLIAFVVLLVGEIATVALTSIWFAIGALAAFIAALFCNNIWVQILVFLFVSLMLLIFTRPLAERYLNKNREKTNVDAVVGKVGIVAQTINNLEATGEVNLAGQIWMARAALDETIEAGCRVVVQEVQGVKLIVKKEDK